MPVTQVRVRGSGFTSFNYRGQPIAWLTNFTDQGQRPGAAPEAITPLDAKYPQAIVTPRYLGMGTITFTITELWNGPVWQQLVGLENAVGIIDPIRDNGVLESIAAETSPITCQMIIKVPGQQNQWRSRTYHNVLIYDIDDTEVITIDAMSVGRNISAVYTHKTWDT
jgi:hypothetical protein